MSLSYPKIKSLSHESGVEAHYFFPWWINPLWGSSVFVAMLVAAGSLFDAESYVLWGVPKYVTVDLTLTAAISGAGFLLGIALALLRRTPGQWQAVRIGPHTIRACSKLATAAFWLSLAGYGFWAAFALAQGASVDHVRAILDFREGSVGALKRVSAPVAGFTTLTQFAAIAVSLRYFLMRLGFRENRYEVYLILTFSVARAFFLGERLALIEVAVPMILLTVIVSGVRREASRNVLVRTLLPVLGVPALWSLFAVFEYSRSWLYYRATTDKTFVEYITDRLVGYYATAINNSSLYHLSVSGRPHDPVFSFTALWDSPVISQMLGHGTFAGIEIRKWWASTLELNANPEFNNAGTFLVVDADLGTIFAFLFWLGLGAFIGLSYVNMKRGRIEWMLTYLVSFIGILELLRIIYWVQGRFVPTLIGLIIFGFAIARARRFDERVG